MWSRLNLSSVTNSSKSKQEFECQGFSQRQMLQFFCILVPVAIVALNLAAHSHLGQWTEVTAAPRDDVPCESLRVQVAGAFPLKHRLSVRSSHSPPDSFRRGASLTCQIRWAEPLKWPWESVDDSQTQEVFLALNRISQVQQIRSVHRPPMLFWLALLVVSAVLVKTWKLRPSAT